MEKLVSTMSPKPLYPDVAAMPAYLTVVDPQMAANAMTGLSGAVSDPSDQGEDVEDMWDNVPI